MAYEYGYGILEDQLIALLSSGVPDFIAAEKLIAQGANINAEGKNPDENMLSEILSGCCWFDYENEINEECQGECDNCQENLNLNPAAVKLWSRLSTFFLITALTLIRKMDVSDPNVCGR